jgi:hypothetical protein
MRELGSRARSNQRGMVKQKATGSFKATMTSIFLFWVE